MGDTSRMEEKILRAEALANDAYGVLCTESYWARQSYDRRFALEVAAREAQARKQDFEWLGNTRAERIKPNQAPLLFI